jgi:hypothetical protein
LDSLPVADWSAGAGLNAVLQRDVDMWPFLAPSGSTSGWAPTGNLNVRETPIALQFLDWNSWLPTIHPLDAWGSAFANSTLLSNYNQIRSGLVAGNPQTYQAQSYNIWVWIAHDGDFLSPLVKPGADPAWNTASYTNSIYSVRLWSMTKQWEINQEFGLEGMAQTVFGPQSDARAWLSGEPFQASPNMIHIPLTAAGIGNRLPITEWYTRQIWYQMQLTLNERNDSGTFVGNAPIDFPYVHNHVQALGYASRPTAPQGGLTLLWLIKGLQASNQNGLGPQLGSGGWSWTNSDPSRLYDYATEFMWNDFAPADQITATTGYLQQWISKASSYTNQQYYLGKWTTAAEVPSLNSPNSSFSNAIAFTIPLAQNSGVNPVLTTQMANWAQTVWPNFNWSQLLKATCSPYGATPLCTVR